MRRIAVTVTLLVMAVMLIPGAVSAYDPENELWDSYTTGADANLTIYAYNYSGQTFTVATESHSVNEIHVLGFREGSPGTITVSIRNVNEAGLPTGDDLTSGTFDGDLATNSTNGDWYRADVTDYRLEYGESYAIVIRAEDGDLSNSWHVGLDGSAGAYTGGSRMHSGNGGATWTADTDDDLNFAVYGFSLLDVVDVKVFRNYLETDDMLFALSYYNTYVPYYPNEAPQVDFVLQVRTADGSSLLGQSVVQAWGYKPGCVYLAANETTGLAENSAFRIYLLGNVHTTPYDTYTLNATDWYGSDLYLLDVWCISTAKDIGDYYDTDMTAYVSTGEVLNEIGGVLFSTGIVGLEYSRPDIFQTTIYTPEYDAGTSTYPYETSTTWDAVLGSTVANAFSVAGNIIGLSGRNFGAFGLLLLYGILCLVIVGRGGNALVGAILAVPIIIAGAWLHLIDIAFISIVTGVAVLMTMFRFWFSRT